MFSTIRLRRLAGLRSADGRDDRVVRVRDWLSKQTDRRGGGKSLTKPARLMLDAVERAPDAVQIVGDDSGIRHMWDELNKAIRASYSEKKGGALKTTREKLKKRSHLSC